MTQRFRTYELTDLQARTILAVLKVAREHAIENDYALPAEGYSEIEYRLRRVLEPDRYSHLPPMAPLQPTLEGEASGG